MKSEYRTPIITIEALDKRDVLLASSEAVIPTTPTESATDATTPAVRELENAYRSFGQFIASGDWFD